MKGESHEDGTEPVRQLKGLYKYVNIPLKTLNIIIIALSAALIICMAIGISNRGYMISFDARGGTAVESQKRLYGELLEAPNPPTREGYVFDGWYYDENLTMPWDLNKDVVTAPITLYAGWRET